MKFWFFVLVLVVALGGCWLTVSGQSVDEWVVTSDGDSGEGTLRWAIESANQSDGADVITFVGLMTIRLRSALPTVLDDHVTIRGNAEAEQSVDLMPTVWLDGAAAGDAAGLEIEADTVQVFGLGIVGFERYGIGVIGERARNVEIEGNWIGFWQNGIASPNSLSGIAVLAGAERVEITRNRIGGNSSAGRVGHGIVVGGGGTKEVRIVENVIGFGPNGEARANDDGILVVDAAHATIVGNTIGNSVVAGIELRETREQIAVDGNRIGVRRDGALAPNDVGVFLGPGSANARVGSKSGNVVSGNRVGIAVEQGAREAFIENNWVGLVPVDDDGGLQESMLPSAMVRPNRERGISVIAGAAEVQVRNNVVSAGDFGIVVADANTTWVSLTRNVVAGSRQGPTEAAIDVRSGTEVTIGGGDRSLGNHVCGAEFGIRLASVEEPEVDSNSVGASVASRVTFDSDWQMLWAIRLDDGVVRGKVRNNLIADADQAGISVVGASSQDNSFVSRLSSVSSGVNQFSGNRIDIDLGADGPSVNDDLRDRDRGPNGLLNHPVILSHEVVRRNDRLFRSTLSGTATPGTKVNLYVREGDRERSLGASRPVDRSGHWEFPRAEIPKGSLRALASTTAGATSEFSPPFLPSQRVSIGGGVNWFAWSGPEMAVEEAMSPIQRWVRTVWVWKSSEGRWRGWSPIVPADDDGRRGSLERIATGDVVRLDLEARPPRDFFVPTGVDLAPASSIVLWQGFNSVSWLGERVDAIETLEAFESAQAGLMGSVWQWDGDEWRVIWPRVKTAWDPGQWRYPVLWVRATRPGELSLP